MNILSLRVSSAKGTENLKKNSEIRMEILKVRTSYFEDPDIIILSKEFNACKSVENQVQFVRNVHLTKKPDEAISFLSHVYLQSPLKHAVRGTIVKLFQSLIKTNPDFSRIFTEALNLHLKSMLSAITVWTESIGVVNCVTGLCENVKFTKSAIWTCFPEIFPFLIKLTQSLTTQIKTDSLSPSVKNEIILVNHNTLRCVLSLVQEFVTELKDSSYDFESLREVCRFILDDENENFPMDGKTNCGHLMVIISKIEESFDQLLDSLTNESLETISVERFCTNVGIIVDFESDELIAKKDQIRILRIITMETRAFAKAHSKEQQNVLGASRLIFKITKLISSLEVADLEAIAEMENLTKICFDFVFSHLENFMDSVRHLSRDSLKMLFEFCKKNIANLGSELDGIIEKIGSEVSKLVKFLTISCLAQVFGSNYILNTFPNIREELIANFSEHNFDVSASNCYEILMQENRNEISSELWCERWIDPLTAGLNDLVSTDINKKIVFETLISKAVKQNPKIVEEILKKKNSVPTLVLLIVLAMARKCGQFDKRESSDTHWKGVLEYEYLRLAMVDFDDRVRVISLRLLAEAHKSTEPFSLAELDLLKFFFEFNTNAQSPATRDQILCMFKNIFLRIKALLCSADKKKQEFKQINVDFLDWLKEKSVNNLDVSGNYSRRCLSLKVLDLILPVLKETSASDDLLTVTQTKILLNAFKDSYEGNKSIALDILLKFASKDILVDYYSDLSLIESQIKSVNPTESLTSAFHLELMCTATDSLDSFVSIQDPVVELKVYAALKWCESITNNGLEIARNDLFKSAQENPIYGSLYCIKHLMSKLNTKSISTCPIWRKYFINLIKICFDCSDAVVEIVNNSSPEGHLPNDFGSSKPSKVTSQMVLLLGWRTIKEVSLILGEISQLPVIREDAGFLTFEQLFEIGKFFKDLLATTKHRGAFEQAYVGFSRLCARLWVSKESELHDLPMKWLVELMGIISGEITSKSEICATRRSAGVPFMVQALITSEIQVCSSSALKYSMSKLLQFCETGTIAETRTHSLNILRALFRCSDLNDSVIEYVEQGLMAAIRSFTGETWSEKNSATLLFSALVVRIFGVQRTKELEEMNVRNKMTGRIFFLRYPKLYDFFIYELTKAAVALDRDESTAKLYPILLILSRIYPSALEGTESSLSLNAFVNKIESCSKCPDIKTRLLIGKAIASLLATNFYWGKLQEIIVEIDGLRDSNTIHSKLLILLHLVRDLPESAIGRLTDDEILSGWCGVLALRLNWDNMVLVGVFVDILLTLCKRFDVPRLRRSSSVTDTLVARLEQIGAVLLRPDQYRRSIMGNEVVMAPFLALQIIHAESNAKLLEMLENYVQPSNGPLGLNKAALSAVLLLVSDCGVVSEDLEINKWLRQAINVLEVEERRRLKGILIGREGGGFVLKVCQEHLKSLSFELKSVALATLAYLPGFKQSGLNSLPCIEAKLVSKELSYEAKASIYKWYLKHSSQFNNDIDLRIVYSFASIENPFEVRLVSTEIVHKIPFFQLMMRFEEDDSLIFIVTFARIVLLLLQDDDSEVRESMCRCVCNLIAKYENTSKANFVELYAQQCFVKWLSRTLVEKVGTEKATTVLVLVLLEEGRTLTTARVEQQQSSDTTEADEVDECRVFDRNEANVFAEPQVCLQMLKGEIRHLAPQTAGEISLQNAFLQFENPGI